MRGKGEFLFYSIMADDVMYEEVDGSIEIMGNPLSYVIHRADEVKDNDEWKTVNFEIFIWDLESDGSRMKHVLYEDDGGESRSIDVSLSATYQINENLSATAGFSLPIRIQDGDDLIGESIVEYCQDIDSNGFEYHPSNKVDFTLSERTN